MKNRTSTFILLLVFFIGLSVLLYPSLADFWNSKTQSQAIVDYEAMLENMTPADYTAHFDAADDYNRRLRALKNPLLQWQEAQGYMDVLNLSGTGIIGYIRIDKIGLELPVYHTTSHAVLSIAVGHMEGTSLPIGGESTHSVLSAHRGLPTAELFTYLDRLEIGDTFVITVLDRMLTYEVDQIRIVNPDDTSLIGVVEGEDYCTLLTCTPYGINTQRLLVRGTRIENNAHKTLVIRNEAFRVDPMIVMPMVALPILAVLMLYVLFAPVKKEKLGESIE